MLFMIVETFKNGDPKPVGERFKTQGRMFPDGVHYLSSWIDPSAMRCFQVMEAPNREAILKWTAHWEDLVDFEIVPVLTSAEFWSQVAVDVQSPLT